MSIEGVGGPGDGGGFTQYSELYSSPYVQAASRSEAGARTGGKLMQDGSKRVQTT